MGIEIEGIQQEQQDVAQIEKRNKTFTPVETTNLGFEKFHPFDHLLTGLRDEGLPISTAEWLDLQRCLDAGRIHSLPDLHTVSRAVLVKDSGNYDSFDQVFARMFYNIDINKIDENDNNDEEDGELNDYDERDEYNSDEDERQYSIENRIWELKREGEEPQGEELRLMAEALESVTEELEKRKQQKANRKSDRSNKPSVSQDKQLKKGQLLPKRESMHKPYEKTGKYLHGKWWESSRDDVELERGEYENSQEYDDDYDADEQDPEEKDLERLQYELQTLLLPQMQPSTDPHESQSEMPTTDAKKILEKFKKSSTLEDVPKNDEAKHDGDNKGTEEKSETSDDGKQGKPSLEGTKIEHEGNFDEKEQLLEELKRREWKRHDPRQALTREQFGRALAEIRSVIQDTTQVRTRKLDIKKTVKNIAAHPMAPEFIYTEEVDQESPDVMLFVDVSGSVDEFRSMVEDLLKGAKDVLKNLQTYYFFNGIYDEVYRSYDSKDNPSTSRENRLLDPVPLKTIMSQDPDTKVIIYGDGLLHYEPDEFPEGERSATENFRELSEQFPGTVWFHPALKANRQKFTHSQVEEFDNADTILMRYEEIRKTIQMFDVSLVGINQAVRRLMEQ